MHIYHLIELKTHQHESGDLNCVYQKQIVKCLLNGFHEMYSSLNDAYDSVVSHDYEQGTAPYRMLQFLDY